MAKPRIVIADSDINYIIPLQHKFAEDFFEKVEIEVITDGAFLDEMFSTPQRIDILIISEEMNNQMLQRHNIAHIFLMTEQYEEEKTADLRITPIFKYTSIKEIFNEIVGKSADVLQLKDKTSQTTQVVLVCSASGGTGKTTVAMGISASLTKNYKKVLYINASRLHSFQYMLESTASITSPEVYAKLNAAGDNIYSEIKHVIRNELFSYIPPFKAALISLGLEYDVYEKIVLSAKKSGDFDFVIIDADVAFDDNQARLINLADKVVVVTNQSMAAVVATNVLVSNVNGMNSEKYIFICNNFSKDQDNALISPKVALKFTVSDYIDHFSHASQIKPDELAKESSIQRAAFLII